MTSVPGPALVRAPDPPIAPARVAGAVPLTATVLGPLRVMAPVPVFSGLVPPKVTSPFHTWALPAIVTGDPLVLSIVAPLATFSAPLPRALPLLTLSVPELSVVPPV